MATARGHECRTEVSELLELDSVCQDECMESPRTPRRQVSKLVVDMEKLNVTLSNAHLVQIGKQVTLYEAKHDGGYGTKPRHNSETSRATSHSCERNRANGREEGTTDETLSYLESRSSFSTAKSSKRRSLMAAALPDDADTILGEICDANEAGVEQFILPSIQKQGSLKTFKCEIVMKELEKLQDNGQFEAHEKLACGLLEFYTAKDDPDMRATLMIERGMAFYYGNDSKKCKRLFTAALRMGDALENRELLEGRALFLKAAAYRREKKFNKALQCLQRAEFLLFNQESGEDKAELYYNYGTLWLDMYSTKSSNDQRRRVLRKEAKECFEKAIEHCTKDPRSRVQIKMKRYYNLKIAALNLDCSSKAARKSWQICHEDVEEAGRRLDFVECQLSEGIPLGTKVQLLMTRSDQHYRQGNLHFATEVAKEGLEIAKDINMNSAIVPLRARIEELETATEASQPRHSAPVMSVLYDSGCSGDESSSDRGR